MALITLTTDFGNRDPYVGAMRGIILGIAPEARLVDVCHDVPPQDIVAGMLALEMAVACFPPGTIHLAIVDPGVGSARRPLAVRTDRFVLIGPDNGLFTLALASYPVREAVTLDNPRFHRLPVCPTFHGRDIFAPCAGHLAAGVPLRELGTPADDIQRYEPSRPTPDADGLRLTVLAIDRFGNIITNLRSDELPALLPGCERFTLDLHGRTFPGPARTFTDVEDGQLVAYFGSAQRLEIALRNGNAAAALRVSPGDHVHLNRA